MVCRELLNEGAFVAVYDPQVPYEQMAMDLTDGLSEGAAASCTPASAL